MKKLKSNKKILITGCGRSGTTFVCEFLKSLGLKVGHEKDIEKNGIVSWQLTFNEHEFGHNRAQVEDYSQFDHIIHIIRNPLDSFQSYPTIKRGSWECICKNIPEIKLDDDSESKFVKYWCLWNKKAEKLSEVTIKIEELREKIPLLLELFNIKNADEYEVRDLYDIYSKSDFNSRKTHKCYGFKQTLSDKNSKMLKKYSSHYGY